MPKRARLWDQVTGVSGGLQLGNISGVSGLQDARQKNAAAIQRAAQAANTNFEFGTLGATGATGGVQLAGTNITGVSGAQQNAAALQRAGQATNTNFEFGTELGATGIQLAGNNTTGVSVRQDAQMNANVMQWVARNS